MARTACNLGLATVQGLSFKSKAGILVSPTPVRSAKSARNRKMPAPGEEPGHRGRAHEGFRNKNRFLLNFTDKTKRRVNHA